MDNALTKPMLGLTNVEAVQLPHHQMELQIFEKLAHIEDSMFSLKQFSCCWNSWDGGTWVATEDVTLDQFVYNQRVRFVFRWRHSVRLRTRVAQGH